MLSLEPYYEAIGHLCERLRVQRLDVVGSAARDDFGPDSDIDVLVTFVGQGRLSDRDFTLKEGLEALFHRPVDVMTEETVGNPFVRRTLDL